MEPTPNQSVVLSGLARQLVNSGLLNDTVAKEVVIEAKQKKERLVSRLVKQEYLSAKAIATCCASNIGFPLFDLQYFDIKSLDEELISPELCIEHHFIPLLKRGSRLYIAVSDPMQMDLFDKIKFHARLNPSPIIVEEDKLQHALEQLAHTATAAALGDIDDESLSSLETSSSEASTDETTADEEDAPIVRFINKIILSAIQKGASDIHFEPYEKSYRIRFRLDGILTEIATPTHKMATRFAARLKVMSRLDLSERRVPQDGRFKLKISNTRSIDFRISTCPTLYGEKVVLRVLDNENTQLDFEKLGIKDHYQQLLLHHIKRPQGMILVTGPTGSGKTVTLYTCLNLLNEVDKNISTVEDPVEINLPGINQVHVNLKAGLTFPAALRSFLRQDPDIIMVGEIRDLETAEIGIKAAQTGHLVFSTLHTNSATETLTRLVNMGVPGFNIATSVSLIIAQRLVRRLCEHCKAPIEIPEKTLLAAGFEPEQLQMASLFKPVGCNKCNHGFKGRIGLYEMLEMSDEIGQLIMQGGNALDIAKLAQKAGFRTLRQAGLNLVAEGITCLEEIERITVN